MFLRVSEFCKRALQNEQHAARFGETRKPLILQGFSTMHETSQAEARGPGFSPVPYAHNAAARERVWGLSKCRPPASARLSWAASPSRRDPSRNALSAAIQAAKVRGCCELGFRAARQLSCNASYARRSRLLIASTTASLSRSRAEGQRGGGYWTDANEADCAIPRNCPSYESGRFSDLLSLLAVLLTHAAVAETERQTVNLTVVSRCGASVVLEKAGLNMQDGRSVADIPLTRVGSFFYAGRTTVGPGRYLVGRKCPTQVLGRRADYGPSRSRSQRRHRSHALG